MLKIALNGRDGFIADDYEVKLKDYSYSVNTMKHLKEKYTDSELYFIIGGDSLCDLPKWYKPEELLKLCTLLVYPRGESDIDSDICEMTKMYGGKIYPLKAPTVDVSSTQIRSRIKEGKDVSKMLPDGVVEYIRKHKIYTESR